MPEFTMEGLTEEQNAAIRAEIDRRVTSAVNTARGNFETSIRTSLESEYQTKLQQELDAATKQANMTEQEKVENALEALRNEQLKLAQERRSFEAKKRLEDSGVDAATIELLLPFMGTMENADQINQYIDSFVEARKSTIDTALEAQKQKLATNAAPPVSTGSQTVQRDINTQINDIYSSVDDPRTATAMAAQLLINQANEG